MHPFSIQHPAPKPVQPGEFFNAVRASKFELMLELLARGADINERDSVGNTPLMYVSGRTGYPSKFIQLLLDRGALINEAGNAGNTALILASSVNNIAVVQLLLDKGAVIESENKLGLNAEEIARRREHVQILRIIEAMTETRRKIAEEKARIDAAHELALRSQEKLKQKSQRRRPPGL